jgi:hypothetical protein
MSLVRISKKHNAKPRRAPVERAKAFTPIILCDGPRAAVVIPTACRYGRTAAQAVQKQLKL